MPTYFLEPKRPYVPAVNSVAGLRSPVTAWPVARPRRISFHHKEAVLTNNAMLKRGAWKEIQLQETACLPWTPSQSTMGHYAAMPIVGASLTSCGRRSCSSFSGGMHCTSSCNRRRLHMRTIGGSSSSTSNNPSSACGPSPWGTHGAVSRRYLPSQYLHGRFEAVA